MSASLLWSNLLVYSVQIGLLVGVAATAPTVLRLASPRAKLAYWQVLLAACLLLPAMRPWQPQAIAENISVTTTIVATSAPSAPPRRSFSVAEIALAAVAFGALCRLVWLGVGLARLRRLRRAARPFHAALPWPSRAELRIAPGVTSPVTFGVFRPLVLLPPQFPSLDERARQAILCHELLHVDRRDWAFTLAEELVRAVFWFHPAIWWLLGEIQLAREQAVDRAVIDVTQAKDEYVDALLAIAGARAQLDLAPAPLFLRKRHLRHRVVSILKEARMSKTRLASALAGSVCILAAAAWFVTNTFPLSAAPQIVQDAPGVTVDAGGGTLLHRAPVAYPESARGKGVKGVVVVELTFDANGNVADARALSGPEELRKPALESVLQWHFAHETAGNKRQVTIAFTPPATPAPELSRATDSVRLPKGATYTLKSITVLGLSDDAKSELLAKLPVRVGDPITADMIPAIAKAAREFDEHLSVVGRSLREPDFALTIVGPQRPAMAIPAPMAPSVAVASTPQDTAPMPPDRIKIGGNEQAMKLVRQPRPVYPPDAKEARIQGVVQLSAVIAKDGTVQRLEVLTGHPLLVPSALEAVRQWVYEPTLLNGNPVEVQTQIDVNYTLSQ